MSQRNDCRTRKTVHRPQLIEWRVLRRAVSHGLQWGAIFGALAGLPFAIIGALPGSVVGAAAGLVSSIAPGVALATRAAKWRLGLGRAGSVPAVLAAAPWFAAVLFYSSRNLGMSLALLGCAAAAGLTMALLTPRILNGAPPLKRTTGATA